MPSLRVSEADSTMIEPPPRQLGVEAELGLIMWGDNFFFFGWGEGPTYVNTKPNNYI